MAKSNKYLFLPKIRKVTELKRARYVAVTQILPRDWEVVQLRVLEKTDNYVIVKIERMI